MSFLLDTNVISEWVKTRPDPGVITWLAGVDEERGPLRHLLHAAELLRHAEAAHRVRVPVREQTEVEVERLHP